MQRGLYRSGAILLLLALVACAKAGALPVAFKSPDQTVTTGTVVTLDAGGSTDPAGGRLRYGWSFDSIPAGSLAAFALADTPTPQFVADMPGTYKVRLVVFAQDYASEPALTTVTASACGANVPTVGSLVATPNNSSVGVAVKLTAPEVADLDNSATCDLHQTLTYAWSFLGQPSGSRARFADRNAVSPAFTPDVDGPYRVQLIVTDSTGRSSDPAAGIIVVSVQSCGNHNPSVDALAANPPQPGLGIATQLSATISDADNIAPCSLHQSVSYQWSLVGLPPSSHAFLNSTTVVNPSFAPDVAGDYVARLVVTDNTGLASAAKDLKVNASSCGGAPPVAQLSFAPAAPGIGSTVQLGAQVTSQDKLSCGLAKTFTYAWSVLQQPVGSAARLNDPTAADPSFVADQPGNYLVSLEVTDSAGLLSDPQTITITAAACGNNPASITSLTPSVAKPVVGQQVVVSADVFNPDQSCVNFTLARSYAWTVVTRPTGSAAFFTDPTAPLGSVTVDAPGSYRLALVVTEASGIKSKQAFLDLTTSFCGLAAPSVTGTSAAPADPNRTAIDPGQPVALSAVVQDADNDRVACPTTPLQTFKLSWRLDSRPLNSSAVLSDPGAVSPQITPDQPGTYQYSVVATDSTGLSSARAYGTFTPSSCGTHAATLTALPAQVSTAPHAGVLLTATPSDPDAACGIRKTFTYQWSVVTAPLGSAGSFDNAASPSAVFTPDSAGAYSLSVAATDSAGNVSAPAFVQVATGSDGLPFEPAPELGGHAAKNAIAVIKYSHLAPRYRARRPVELRPDAPLRRDDSRRDPFVAIPDAHPGLQREAHAGGKRYPFNFGAARKKRVFVSEAHGPFDRVDFCHKCRLPERDPEPFSLPDGKSVHARVRADDPPVRVDEGPRTNAPFGARFYKRRVRVRPRPHEAKLDAFALLRAGEGSGDRLCSDFDFRAFAEREDQTGELLGGGSVEKIALVFGWIAPAKEPRGSVFVAFDPRVMAGGDLTRAESVGNREELSQFDGAIARGAGARRFAREVRIDERRDDLFGEELPPIERKMREPERIGRAPRVVLVLRRAAAAVAPRGARIVGVVPEVERDADHLIPRVVEARRRDGGVDAAAHRHHDALARFHRRVPSTSRRYCPWSTVFTAPCARSTSFAARSTASLCR